MVKKAEPKWKPRPTVVAVGWDISMSVFAGCAKMYDGVLNKMRGPVWYEHRFDWEDDFNTRMASAARAHEHILDLIGVLGGAIFDRDQIFIGVEEIPFGYMGKGASKRIRQQCQIQGAFLSGICRWGWNPWEVNVKNWRSVIADDFEMKQNKEFDKWTVVEWVKEVYPDVPDWPDLISSAKGLKPKPSTSTAKPQQPDDRYDSTGIMEWVWDRAMQETKLKKKVKLKEWDLSKSTKTN